MNLTTILHITTIAVQAAQELFSLRTREELTKMFELGEEIVTESLMIGVLAAGIAERVFFGQLDPLVTDDLKDRGLRVHPSGIGSPLGQLTSDLYQYYLTHRYTDSRSLTEDREALTDLIRNHLPDTPTSTRP